jgi:hypothetical protein
VAKEAPAGDAMADDREELPEISVWRQIGFGSIRFTTLIPSMQS